MSANDEVNMTLNTLHCLRKLIRWDKKYFSRLLYTARIIYKQITSKKKEKKNEHISSFAYKRNARKIHTNYN